MTVPKLNELQRRLGQLRTFIGPENRTDEAGAIERLAEFVMLNPHASDYAQRIEGLLGQIEDKDRLRDNILLAQAKLVADEQLRAEKLSELHKNFGKTDGGMSALYELGLLKIGWYQGQSNSEQKKKYLADARATLESFLNLYPNSFCAEQVKKNLDGLPSN
jgi:outer membrane protein assembly factor BamD (BamD/ComL family)